MKIGIDIRNVGKKRTGDEAVFFGLVKGLVEIDSLNNYKLFTDIDNIETLEDIKKRLGINNKNNFKIVSLKTANKFTWNFWTLPKYLRQNPVDIYLTQYITPFFVPKGIKIATVVHDISFNFFPQHIKFSDLFFLKLLIPISLRRADKIIAVSQFTRDEIIKYYKVVEDKVGYIYNAVSEEFLKQASDVNKVRERYKLPEKYILYLGTLQPRKNIPALIRAYNEIRDKIAGVKLVLAGGKGAHNYDQEIDRVIRELKLEAEVIFTGYVAEEDKAAIFAGAQLFVFPSLYEGFGIPILEAMGRQVPVLLSDIPVHHEVAGEAASYFNLNSLADFSEKMYTTIVNEEMREKLKNLGLQRAEFFSWKKTAEKLLEIVTKN